MQEPKTENISDEKCRQCEYMDYKRGYLCVCNELNEMMERIRRTLIIAESLCIGDAVKREDIMFEPHGDIV